ncbi:DUF748 domain-containing protein [Microbulbifer thermotolerans]|uniref:DUF748 domain-containing protein n=1 Tax=Microbulbifer thermotolerans TaxID=252514 RepID=UPI00224B6096|nr:DUF748 domain-containing protein [Microbulbifer thermotolerans]MCX2841592.1 DUF748 domain-containing protein [Microbulbifer thermotolerans]
MPLNNSPPLDISRRLLWWLVAILLLLGIANLAAGTLLAAQVERWLKERGLDAEIGHLQLSVVNLQLVVSDVRAKNGSGRGFRARELMLDYSWWQLLRGRIQFQRAYLDGAYMDLESRSSESGRRWEVGGWALGQGPRRDRDFRLLLEQVRIRDSTLCYRHRPDWTSPGCVDFGELRVRDFLLGLQRTGDVPLDITIGTDKLNLRNLLITEKASGAVDATLVELALSDGLYRRPGNRISADTLKAQMFGSCPPQRWADALPALQRLVGHCGVARRLQLKGDLLFSFGKSGEVRWRAAQGQDIALRYANLVWHNWRAHRLALKEFHYRRAQKTLRWQSAGASDFDWCPSGLRDKQHHYCSRAGTLMLPDPVTFDWRKKITISTGPSRLKRVQLLDLAQSRRNPFSANLALLGALEYRGETGILSIDGVDLESASGCIPGQLWHQPDYCVRLAGLSGSEQFQVQFGSRTVQRPWGFASGPLRLSQFSMATEGRPQLQLRKLHWQRINLLGAGAPFLLQDFALQFLSGCLPDGLLPEKLHPLCGELANFNGRGHFAWQRGEAGYLIAGELSLGRLRLADQLSGGGLLLQKLHTGEGILRRSADSDHPWVQRGLSGSVDIPVTAGHHENTPEAIEDDSGDEKGLLPEEMAQRREDVQTGDRDDGMPPPDIASPNLKLDSTSLSRLQGCLPKSWARLLFSNPQQMPGCFDLRNWRQGGPLVVAWQGGIDFSAAQLSLEKARASTPAGAELLNLSGLHLPAARLRHLPPPYRSTFVSLPDFSLQDFYGCLPVGVNAAVFDIRCAELHNLHAGKRFELTVDRRKVSAHMSGSRAQWILLAEEGEHPIFELQKLSAPQLEVEWQRGANRPGKLALKDFYAAQLHACLPQEWQLRSDLPRCISTAELHTIGERGLAVAETLFKSSPIAEPLWRFQSLRLAELSLSADTLDLLNLQLQGLRFCGLADLLPQTARQLGIADCASAQQIHLPGTNRIGLTPQAPRIALGPLVSQPITLGEGKTENTGTGLKRLSWKQLRWEGGQVLWTTDLEAVGMRGCVAGSAAAVAEGRADFCWRLQQLRLPGGQRISLSSPFSTDGSIEALGLSIDRGSGDPLQIARIQLDQPSYGGASVGKLSGASGCLTAGTLGDNRLAPCYRLGRVSIQGIDRVDTSSGKVTLLRGVAIEGVELKQGDYPQGLPAQLLQLEQLHTEELRLGSGEIAVRQLRLQGVAGCVPPGYVERLNHCLTLDAVTVSGSYRFSTRQLALAQLQLHKVQLLTGTGRSLVRGDSVSVEQLLSGESEFRFLRAEAEGFAIFDRREGAPEYERHSVIGRLAGMSVAQLHYDRRGNRLEIEKVDALRPRLIVMRDRSGEYPLARDVDVLTGTQPQEKPLIRAADAITEGMKVRYHIRELDVRHGTFTWVDRQGQYRARLPIRAIYLTLRNVSNLPLHPPATVLFNGRPGGFGEIQLAGTIRYLETKKWNADLTGYIENTNLIPATPYMAKLLGYKILQGQLDARLDIRIRENKVNAFADMKLNKIKVRRVQEKDKLPVKSSIIPLDIALLLLKDGQGNVRFDMPVSGDLYDPKFSFSFIFSHLLQRAIIESLFAYFTPVGFYTLAKFAWGRFRAVRFEPIFFEPGKSELDATAWEQLREMVVRLRERPDARPGICGIANARDWYALYPDSTPGLGGSRKAREKFYRNPPLKLFEEFERLAQERSRKIERFLIDEGIGAQELIPCAPDYNGRDFDEPRVEFSR